MDETLAAGLIRDIESLKGRQSVHEAECVLLREGIQKDIRSVNATISSVRTTVDEVKSTLDKLAKQGEHAAWSANWKAWGIAAALGSLILSFAVWEGAQLWALEPLRVQHESTKH